MKPKKEDRRVSRTKKDLKNAFLSLLTETDDLKKVSIMDITARADYNRATFYVHYSDKQCLIDEIINDALDGFLDAFKEPYKQVNVLEADTLSFHTIKIFQYIEADSDTFKLLFMNKAFAGFQDKFSNALEVTFSNDLIFLDELFEGIDKALFVRSQSYFMIGLISYWIEHDFIYSADRMAEQLLLIANYDSSTLKIAKR